MASLQDKITDVRNAARPNSARVSSGRSAAGATLACDNLSGWPTASKVHFVTYQLDSNSNPVAGTQLDCVGIVSSNNIGSFTVIDGTDNGNSVGDVVEMLPTAAWGQDLADALMVAHNRDGSLADGAVDASDVLADGVVSTAKIADDAATAPKVSGIDKSNLTTDSNPYKFSVERTTAFNLPAGSFAKISFDSELFDTNGDFSGGTYTVPVAGFYQINGRISGNGGNQLVIALYKNGVVYQRGGHGSAGAVTGVTFSEIVQVAATDTLEMYVFADTANAAEVTAASRPRFSGFLVSRT